MAASPRYKVYDDANIYAAAFRDPLEAARYIQALGHEGYTARLGHSAKDIFWTHSAEDMGLDDMDALICSRLEAMDWRASV